MTDIDEVLGRLNPKTQQRIKMASSIEVERQALPSLAITKQLGGGLRYGAQHMLWGPRSAGKSLFALQTVALAQADGRSCAWVDAEGAYTPEWGASLGVDNDKFIHIDDEKTYAGVTNRGIELIQAGIDVLVIDSISTLMSGSFFDKNGVDLKDFQDTGQIGQNAKEGAKMCGMFNLVNENTLILIISQVTTNLGGYHAVLTSTVGKKTEHLNTTSIKLNASLAEDNQIKGDVSVGDRVYTKPIGRPVKWTIDKDRGKAMSVKGQYDLYFDGPNLGVDTVGEIVDLGIEAGLIRQGGAWFYHGDDKFQGKPKLIAELRSNPERFEQIAKEL